MKSVSLAPAQKRVECRTDTPLSSGLLALALDLPMACGGHGRCATCHVMVVEGTENLSPCDAKEERTLNMLSMRAANSRLACQARVLGNVVVMVPDAQFISLADELTALIGKRAERDILHAADGRVLVARGQIVTKYVVQNIRESIEKK